VLGASLNAVDDNGAFAHKNSFTFPLLCDTDRSISIAYGACDGVKDRYANRISFLIDEQGTIARVYDSVDPRDHAAQVLADVMGI
jgi:peroxiredoxin Q/BCP